MRTAKSAVPRGITRVNPEGRRSAEQAYRGEIRRHLRRSYGAGGGCHGGRAYPGSETGSKSYATVLPISWLRRSRRFFPEARIAIGPAIESGFYYDFDVEKPLYEEDLEKIESKMAEITAAEPIFPEGDSARRGHRIFPRGSAKSTRWSFSNP